MRRISKKLISATAIILIAAIIISVLHINRLSAQAEGYFTLPGIETIDMNNNVDNPFVIVEIVPQKSEARFGFLIKGEEPISEGRALNEISSKEERTEAMEAFIASQKPSYLSSLMSANAFSIPAEGTYAEVEESQSHSDSFFVNGYYTVDEDGHYVLKSLKNAYRPYVEGVDTGTRYSKYLDVDFDKRDVSLSFVHIDSLADRKINYHGEDYNIYFTYSIPYENGITSLSTAKLADHANEPVYYITSRPSGESYVYNYYGMMQPDGKYILTTSGEMIDTDLIAKNLYAFVKFEKTVLGGEYSFANVTDVSGNNEGESLGGFGVYSHFEVNNTSGDYVRVEGSGDVYEYVKDFSSYTMDEDNYSYSEDKYSFVPSGSTRFGNQIFINNGIQNSEWFKTYVMDIPASELSSKSFVVKTYTVKEFNALTELDADLVVFEGGNYTSDISEAMKNYIEQEIDSRKLPVLIERSFGNYGGNNQTLLTDLTKDQKESSFVNKSVYVYDDKEGAFVSGDFATAFTSVTDGYQDVKDEIYVENEYRAVKNTSKLTHSDVSKATALRYIINNAGQRITTKETVNVLEIEPCYSFEPYYQDKDSSKDNYLRKIQVKGTDKTVSSLTHEILNSGIVSEWINQEGDNSNKSTPILSQTYTKEFIGQIEDLNEKYDLIYIGLDTTTMNTTISSSNIKTNKTVYNDSTMDGVVYSHEGDLVDGGSDKLLWWENGYDLAANDISKYRMSGNDITKEKYNNLVEYIKAGYAVVLADNFFTYSKADNGELTITGVNANVNNQASFVLDYKKVGDGKGSYKESSGGEHYVYVGEGKGKYFLGYTSKSGGSYKASDPVYTYVGEGKGDYRFVESYQPVRNGGDYKLTVSNAWGNGDYSRSGSYNNYTYTKVNDKKGDYNLTITPQSRGGYKKVTEYKYATGGDYVKTIDYTYVGEGNGDSELYYDEGIGDYNKVSKNYSFVGLGNGDFEAYYVYSGKGTVNGVLDPNSYMCDLAKFVLSPIEGSSSGERYIDRNVFVRSELEGSTKLVSKSSTPVTERFKTYLNIAKLNILYDEKNGVPKEYTNENGNNPVYLNGNTLSFCVQLKNDAAIGVTSTTYDAHLYIDISVDGRYSKDEEIKNLSIYRGSVEPNNKVNQVNGHYELTAGQTYFIQRTLPAGYVGMLPWKLVFEQNGNNLVRRAINGYTAVPITSSTRETIKVLQITGENKPNDDDFKNRLNLETDTGVQEQLKKVQDFDIQIKTISAKDFVNGNVGSLFADGEKPTFNTYSQAEYFNILKNYDMLILGFSDCFDFSGSSMNGLPSSKIRNANATEALAEYIESGRSVLFTHDTTSRFNYDYEENANESIYRDKYKWGYYFNQHVRTVVGMDRYNILGGSKLYDFLKTKGDTATNVKKILSHGYTDLELSRYYKSHYYSTSRRAASENISDGQYVTNWNTKAHEPYYATKVNEGQITKYPFEIPDRLSIELTHYQYYQLNLDTDSNDDNVNDDIVVWYCISDVGGNGTTTTDSNGNKIDVGAAERDDIYQMTPNDVRNTYYIYNKGNVTYSGVGHSEINTSEKDENGKPQDISELKLFINTMVAAYKAGVHPPKVVYHDYDSNVPINTANIPYDKALEQYLDDEVVLYFEITDSSFIQGEPTLENKFQVIHYSYGADNTIQTTANDIKVSIYEVGENGNLGKKIIDFDPSTIAGTNDDKKLVGTLDYGVVYALKLKTEDLAMAGEDVMPYVSICICAQTTYKQGDSTKDVESGWGEYNLQIRRTELFDLK